MRSERKLASAAPGGEAEQCSAIRASAGEHAGMAAAQPGDRGAPVDGEAVQRGAVADGDTCRHPDGQRPTSEDRVRDDLIAAPVENRGGRPAVEAIVACAYRLPAEVLLIVREREARA